MDLVARAEVISYRCAARADALLNGPAGRAVDTRGGDGMRAARAARKTRGKGPAMRRTVLVVIGAAAALAGLVWTLQGLGYVGGSFMSGATVWAVIGPLVALAGLVLITLGLRGRRRVR